MTVQTAECYRDCYHCRASALARNAKQPLVGAANGDTDRLWWPQTGQRHTFNP